MKSAAWEPKKVGYKVRPASTSDNLQVMSLVPLIIALSL